MSLPQKILTEVKKRPLDKKQIITSVKIRNIELYNLFYLQLFDLKF